jgi:DNA polymerase theta
VAVLLSSRSRNLDGPENLVYTAPTGGGKSLVADVLMLKRVIQDPTKKAVLVLPYVALVQKLKWLRRVVEGVRKDMDPASQEVAQIPKWKKK